MASALLVASCTPEPDAAPRPNVLLVSIDTLRADHLSSYGYDRETSPNLDALARRGARFERTFSTTSWTLPSHMSMLTGLPISAHGVCDDRLWSLTDDTGNPSPVEQLGVFIPEVLKDEGYRTGGFYTWQYVDKRYGFGPGFETFERWGHTFYSDEVVSAEWNRLREADDKPGLEALQARHPDLFDPTHMSSPETIGRALDWIDEVKADTPDAPFFAFVHLFDVHDPYTPPAPFDTMFDPDYTGTIDGKNITAANSPFVRDMPKADFDHVVALYDGGISYVDAQLGKLFAELEARGELENTIVMVTSDHGEEFFEHGNKTHRKSLFAESVHVPWIVAWPGMIDPGAEIDGATGIIDIAPTIYGLLGLGAPDGTIGRDLAPVLRGEASNEDSIYLQELLLFEAGKETQQRLGLLRGAQHTVLGGELGADLQVVHFDLESDPDEKTVLNVSLLNEPGADQTRDQLDAMRKAISSSREQSRSRNVGSDSLPTANSQAELAAMGYTDGNQPTESSSNSDHDHKLCLDGCRWL
jgi:arylsulfatase A-like enzyme